MRLNLGCGRNIRTGWVNLDRADGPGVDLVADLDACGATPLPLEDNSVEEFLLSHVLEHLGDPLAMMQELHRVAAPGAVMTIRVPYGTSDDAWEDPTHVRPYFLKSFNYFSQPLYWRADYGYRGDWQPEQLYLLIDDRLFGRSADEIMAAVHTQRNVVSEMVGTLRAIKPIRAPRAELQAAPAILLAFGEHLMKLET